MSAFKQDSGSSSGTCRTHDFYCECASSSVLGCILEALEGILEALCAAWLWAFCRDPVRDSLTTL